MKEKPKLPKQGKKSNDKKNDTQNYMTHSHKILL